MQILAELHQRQILPMAQGVHRAPRSGRLRRIRTETMNIQVTIDGVQFPIFESEVTEDWLDSTNCEECFMNPRYCSDLCHRAYLERKRRAKNQQQGESDHGSNHQA